MNRLAAPISQTGENGTSHNWFTSVGTIHNNKAEISKEHKLLLLKSTLHHEGKIQRQTLTKLKPEIVTFYNKTKGRVDAIDELAPSIMSFKTQKHWLMVAFYLNLNLSGESTLMVYIENNKCKIPWRNFLKRVWTRTHNR